MFKVPTSCLQDVDISCLKCTGSIPVKNKIKQICFTIYFMSAVVKKNNFIEHFTKMYTAATVLLIFQQRTG